MAKNRALGGVLHNFLGTFASRNSDLDGYWLFGLLIRDTQQLKIDLMGDTSNKSTSDTVSTAQHLARTKFAEQIDKAGIVKSSLREAQIEITKLPAPEEGIFNGRTCSGYRVKFLAQAITENGESHTSELALFVAPHDPRMEYRSTRRT